MNGMSLLPLGRILSCELWYCYRTLYSFCLCSLLLEKLILEPAHFFPHLFLLEPRLQDSSSRYLYFFAKTQDIQYSSSNSTIPLFIQYFIVVSAGFNFVEHKQVSCTYCHTCKPNNSTREWQPHWTKQHALT